VNDRVRRKKTYPVMLKLGFGGQLDDDDFTN